MPGPRTRAALGARLCLLVLLAALAPATRDAANTLQLPVPSEADRQAPVDHGAGPGVRPRPVTRTTARSSSAKLAPAGVPVGGPDAHLAGLFGPAVPWPINPLHVALLPDGRLLNYGTDAAGNQGAALVYDVWDPALGTDPTAHLTLPNTTVTDIFCSAQTVLA